MKMTFWGDEETVKCAITARFKKKWHQILFMFMDLTYAKYEEHENTLSGCPAGAGRMLNQQ